MSDTQDFEKQWLAKFSDCLDELAGEAIRKTVMAGSETLSEDSNRAEVIAWSKTAIEKLDRLVDAPTAQTIMAGCACHYPKSGLQTARTAYETGGGDVSAAYQILQEQFKAFLTDVLQLEDNLIREIIKKGWGLAGVIEGNTIIATKIPKSSNLLQYLNEPDPQKKRQYYCHCPRIREVLKSSETLSITYCYCGAGFYKDLWEEILQQPVKVEILESVLKGDDVCKIAIHLPGS